MEVDPVNETGDGVDDVDDGVVEEEDPVYYYHCCCCNGDSRKAVADEVVGNAEEEDPPLAFLPGDGVVVVLRTYGEEEDDGGGEDADGETDAPRSVEVRRADDDDDAEEEDIFYCCCCPRSLYPVRPETVAHGDAADTRFPANYCCCSLHCRHTGMVVVVGWRWKNGLHRRGGHREVAVTTGTKDDDDDVATVLALSPSSNRPWQQRLQPQQPRTAFHHLPVRYCWYDCYCLRCYSCLLLHYYYCRYYWYYSTDCCCWN